MTEPHSSAGRRWIEDEENQELRRFEDGLSIQQIAKLHDRSAGGIRSRLVKLGPIDVGEKSPIGSSSEPRPSPREDQSSPIPTEDSIFSVTELNRLAKKSIESFIGRVTVRGEISGIREYPSGSYFALKDEDSEVRAVMWKSSVRRLTFDPKDGLEVKATGLVTVYDKKGTFQIVVNRMEPAGVGSLHAQFLKLKKQLQKEGLFDSERKRPLPPFPRRIAVITSIRGDAIRDLVKVLRRRSFDLSVDIYPSHVQGKGAAEEMVKGIEILDTDGRYDLIVLTRGGGSPEDLWEYNHEVLARAIVASNTPIVSAVGHEADISIADLVADATAATPTAAGELIVPDRGEQALILERMTHDLNNILEHQVLRDRQRLLEAVRSLDLNSPAVRITRWRKNIQQLEDRSARLLEARIHQNHRELDGIDNRLKDSIFSRLRSQRSALERVVGTIEAMDPNRVLKRGYSMTLDGSGRALKSTDMLKIGDKLTTRLAKGQFASIVEKVEDE